MQDELFKAFADSTRREILTMLGERDLTAGEIASHFKMTKPSISRHLSLLVSAGLIKGQRRGQNIVYSLNALPIRELIRWFYTAFGNVWMNIKK